MTEPRQGRVPFASREEALAYVQTGEFRKRFDAARVSVIRADERRRVVEALRHHGHSGSSTAFYEAADFIERHLDA